MKENTLEEQEALAELKARLRTLKELNALKRDLSARLQRLREEISAEFLLFYAQGFKATKESIAGAEKQEQELRERCNDLEQRERTLSTSWKAFQLQTPEEKKHNFRAMILQEQMREKARKNQREAEAKQSKAKAKQEEAEAKQNKTSASKS